MKKIIIKALVLVLGLMSFMTVITFTRDETITKTVEAKMLLASNGSLKGDLNNNGKIDLQDVTILLKKYLGLDTESESTNTSVGDLNNNGKIDLQDITILLKKYLGLDTEYTIIFNSMSGTNIDPIIAETGTKITKPADPIKEGTTFVGWYTSLDYNEEFVFDVMPSKDMTLYAKYIVSVDDIVIEALNSFESSEISIVKDNDDINVYFKDTTTNLSKLVWDVFDLFEEFTGNSNYENVYFNYKGRNIDYLNLVDKNGDTGLIVFARFVGWLTKGLWSGSAASESKTGDFIGKTIDTEIVLVDGVINDDNNKNKKYNINFLLND